MVKRITALVVAVIGLIVIIMGASISGKDVTTSSYSFSAGYYDVAGASFGADFYTYMYDASDVMVDELYGLNKGMSEMIEAQNSVIRKSAETTEAVYKACGMIVIAIGLALIAWDVPKLVEAFVPENLLQKKEEPAAETEVPSAE